MSKVTEYCDLVIAYFAYHNHKSPVELLAETISRLQEKGYDPLFCAKFLEKSLRDEVDRLPTFGE